MQNGVEFRVEDVGSDSEVEPSSCQHNCFVPSTTLHNYIVNPLIHRLSFTCASNLAKNLDSLLPRIQCINAPSSSLHAYDAQEGDQLGPGH
jgi:hypothetical protein